MSSLVVGAFSPSVLLRVARRAGHLDHAGLEVDEVAVASSPAQFRSLIDGQLDAVLTSPDNVVAYRLSPSNPLGRLADVRIVSAVDCGLGLGLYAGPGRTGDLAGATLGVDVPTSGYAFAMYALAQSIGFARDDYQVVALGSTPARLQALLAGACDATMLNAGNELVAEQAGCERLAGVGDLGAPYLATVLGVLGERRLGPVRVLADALAATAAEICSGRLDDVAAAEAAAALGVTDAVALQYVERLKSPTEGLVVDGVVDLAALSTVVDLRRRYLPCVQDGVDLLAPALDPGSGLVDRPPAPAG